MKRKSVAPSDVDAANQAESVIASKSAEVQALQDQIAKNLELEAELHAKAAAADARMKALEDKLAQQESRFEERMSSFFSGHLKLSSLWLLFQQKIPVPLSV